MYLVFVLIYLSLPLAQPLQVDGALHGSAVLWAGITFRSGFFPAWRKEAIEICEQFPQAEPRRDTQIEYKPIPLVGHELLAALQREITLDPAAGKVGELVG